MTRRFMQTNGVASRAVVAAVLVMLCVLLAAAVSPRAVAFAADEDVIADAPPAENGSAEVSEQLSDDEATEDSPRLNAVLQGEAGDAVLDDETDEVDQVQAVETPASEEVAEGIVVATSASDDELIISTAARSEREWGSKFNASLGVVGVDPVSNNVFDPNYGIGWLPFNTHYDFPSYIGDAWVYGSDSFGGVTGSPTDFFSRGVTAAQFYIADSEIENLKLNSGGVLTIPAYVTTSGLANFASLLEELINDYDAGDSGAADYAAERGMTAYMSDWKAWLASYKAAPGETTLPVRAFANPYFDAGTDYTIAFEDDPSAGILWLAIGDERKGGSQADTLPAIALPVSRPIGFVYDSRIGGSGTDVALPANCVAISNMLFSGNSAITSVDMSGTAITELPGDVFSGCDSLARVVLPNGRVLLRSGSLNVHPNASTRLEVVSATGGVSFEPGSDFTLGGSSYASPFGDTYIALHAPASWGGSSTALASFYNAGVLANGAAVSAYEPASDGVKQFVFTNASNTSPRTITGDAPVGASVVVLRELPDGSLIPVSAAVDATGHFEASGVSPDYRVHVRVFMPGHQDYQGGEPVSSYTGDYSFGTIALTAAASGAAAEVSASLHGGDYVVTGQYFTVRIAYTLPSGVVTGVMRVTLPNGASVDDTSFYVGNSGATVTVNADGTIAIPLVGAAMSGNVFISTKTTAESLSNLTATVLANGTEALASVSIDPKYIHIVTCEPQVSLVASSQLVVFTAPGAGFTVMVDGVAAGHYNAGYDGKAAVVFPLAAPSDGKVYAVSVLADDGHASEEFQIEWVSGANSVVEFAFKHIGYTARLVSNGSLTGKDWYWSYLPYSTDKNTRWYFSGSIRAAAPVKSVKVTAVTSGGVTAFKTPALSVLRGGSSSDGYRTYTFSGECIDVDGYSGHPVNGAPNKFVLSWTCNGVEFSLPIYIRGIIDPSGTAYAGAYSDKVEGAEAVIYEGGEGDEPGTASKWDAGPYDQENGQVTGPTGAFQWDTPEGWWQVRASKDGYTGLDYSAGSPAQADYAATEWLHVMPPHLDLLLPLFETAQPAIESVSAWADGIEVVFSQWMDTRSAYTASVNLGAGGTGNGPSIDGVWEWVSAELGTAIDGAEALLAKALRFTPNSALSGEVSVSVLGAKSYNGQYAPTLSQLVAVQGGNLPVAVMVDGVEVGEDGVYAVDAAGGAVDISATVLDAFGAPAGASVKLVVVESDMDSLPVGTEFNVGADGGVAIALADAEDGLHALKLAVEGTSATLSLLVAVDPANATIAIGGADADGKAEGGSASKDKGAYKMGETVVLTATPDEGYKFDKWVIEGEFDELVELSAAESALATQAHGLLTAADAANATSASASISFRAYGDVTATPTFLKIQSDNAGGDGEDTGNTGNDNGNDGNGGSGDETGNTGTGSGNTGDESGTTGNDAGNGTNTGTNNGTGTNAESGTDSTDAGTGTNAGPANETTTNDVAGETASEATQAAGPASNNDGNASAQSAIAKTGDALLGLPAALLMLALIALASIQRTRRAEVASKLGK